MRLKDNGRGLKQLVGQRIGFRRYRSIHQVIMAARAGLGFSLYGSGGLRFWQGRRRPRNSPIILMYHSVGGRGLSPDIVISPKHFEDHIRYLRRRYRPLALETVVDLMKAGQPVPLDAIVITFDDGYRDTYENALPVLRRYDCPATVFVTVEPVETGRIPWPQVLWRCLDASRRRELHASWQGANGATLDRVLPLGTQRERAKARSVLKLFASRLGAREREDFLEMIAQDLECGAALDQRQTSGMITWSQLREMRRLGISIGGHTMTHPRLSGLDAETVRYELAESRRILSRELETDIRLFAYPFGGRGWFDEDTKRAVAEAGYAAGCSAVLGNRNAPVDLRALDRVYVPDEPVWRFALRLRQLETESRVIAWTLRKDD